MSSEIKRMVSKGLHDKAIEHLLVLVKKIGDDKLENKLYNISGRYVTLEEEGDEGIFTSEQIDSKRSKLNRSLLRLIDVIQEELNEKGFSIELPENKLMVKDGSEDVLADINEMETNQHIERLKELLDKRKFFQDQFDISSDANQKYSLMKNIEQLTENIDLLKKKLN